LGWVSFFINRVSKRLKMTKKSSSKKKIYQDTDGTWFCNSCGKAGYADQSQAHGHLRWCKGVKGLKREIQKEVVAVDKMFPELAASHGLEDIIGETEPLSVSPNSYFDNPQKEASKRQTLRGTLRGTLTPDPQGAERSQQELVVELHKLRSQNQALQKYAYNHVQHAGRGQTFGGPNDLLSSGLSDVMKIPFVRWAVGLGAFLFIMSWIKESADKLSGTVSNNKAKR
jgi:hypothetical protein